MLPAWPESFQKRRVLQTQRWTVAPFTALGDQHRQCRRYAFLYCNSKQMGAGDERNGTIFRKSLKTLSLFPAASCTVMLPLDVWHKDASSREGAVSAVGDGGTFREV